MTNRLKSLELQGIKTFATTTHLEFPGKITAIIGPNGSGKSNIADSVRWVLGEQSYSTLRAKRTEDMIFSGSQQRSRSGMASATITFNNEDGWLPIDFSEVSISRRAYRDGQNEYLLNGQKVRLKDISEILAQTGLSERTYTIIGQGLVDVALALRPDERRQLFEEAAGIGLYRSRKEEAVRRLESTRKNIERVLDILAEIKPRLRSLERQAGRYKEYQSLNIDLHEKLRTWYGFLWHQKQQDFRTVSLAYQDQEQRLMVLKEKHEEAIAKVEESRRKLQINHGELEKVHGILSDYHQTLEKVNRELAIVDERQRASSLQKSNLEIDLANLEEELKELEIRKTDLKKDIDQQATEVEKVSDDFNQVNEQLALITKQKNKKERQIEGLQQEKVSLETEKVRISAQQGSIQSSIQSLSNESGKIEASIEDLKHEISILVESIDAMKTLAQEKAETHEEVGRRQEELANLINEIRLEKNGVDQHLARLETNLAKSQARLDILDQAEAALSGYSEGSKTIVENSRQGNLPAGIEPLSKHFIVDAKFEKAIGAALGELTDLLVVPSAGKKAVIDFLVTKNNHRVAIFPMEVGIKPTPSNKFQQKDGYLVRGNEVITVSPQFRNVVDQLFSKIHIVRDELCARTIQSDLVANELVVTLNGLVFQSNGIMISGQAASGIRLGRTRQRYEIDQDINSTKKAIEIAKDKKNSVVSSFSSLTEQFNSMQSKRQKALDEKESAWQAVQVAEEKLRHFQEQQKWLQERQIDVNSKIKDNENESSKNSERLLSIDENLGLHIQQERQLQSELASLPVFETQRVVNQLKTQKLVIENAQKTNQDRLKDHIQQAENVQNRIDTFQTRLSELDENLISNKQKQVELSEKTVQINNGIKAIQDDQITPLSENKEIYARQVSALEKLEEHSHQQVIAAERKFTQLQLELSRRKDQLQTLREKIEDDFGVVSYEYEDSIEGPTPLPFDDRFIQNLPSHKTIPEGTEAEIKSLKGRIKRIGVINQEAETEYLSVKDRFEFLTQQIEDLEKANLDLQEVIETLDRLMERDFLKTFKAVNKEFSIYFSQLFNGGEAKLVIPDNENPVEGGVDIIARLPGRRHQGLALLSGGERSLTAVALIFALLKVSPTPFCILDEVDAMLDESNVGRFTDLL